MVYALPLICIAVQDEMMMPLESGEGPLGLIICPSRELANQTVEVITQFTEAIKTVSSSALRQYNGPAWGWLCAVYAMGCAHRCCPLYCKISLLRSN